MTKKATQKVIPEVASIHAVVHRSFGRPLGESMPETTIVGQNSGD